MMDACRSEQVAQVIHLEVVPVLKRQRVGVAVARADQHGRVDVTVRALGFGDDADDVVEALVEFRVLVDRQHRASGLHPFVEVAVVERRAAVPAFGQTGGDAEVLKVMTVVCAFHQPPHGGNHLRAAILEAVRPETARPADFIEGDGLNRSMRTHASIRRITHVCGNDKRKCREHEGKAN